MPLQRKPTELEAERIVLGTVLKGNYTVQRVVLDCLQPTDVSEADGHKAILAAIRAVDQRTDTPWKIATANNVAEELERRGHLEPAGGKQALDVLVAHARDEQIARKALLQILDASGRRQLAALAADLNAAAASPSRELLQAILDGRHRLADIAHRLKPSATVETRLSMLALLNFYETLNTSEGGLVRTGYAEIDEKLLGFRPGDLCVFAVHPQVDVTAFLAGIIARGIVPQNEGIPAGLITLRDSQLELLANTIQRMSPIRVQQIIAGEVTGRDWAEVTNAADVVLQRAMSGHLTICRTTSQSLAELRMVAGMMRQEKHIRLLIVDDPDVLNPAGKKADSRSYMRVARGLKELAQELNITVILLAGLKQQPVDKPPAPTMTTVYELGPMAVLADALILLWHASDTGLGGLETASTTLNAFVARHWHRPGCRVSMPYHRAWRIYGEEQPPAWRPPCDEDDD